MNTVTGEVRELTLTSGLLDTLGKAIPPWMELPPDEGHYEGCERDANRAHRRLHRQYKVRLKPIRRG